MEKKKLLVVMSHQLQQEQIDDFGGEVITLSEINPDLQKKASNIPAEAGEEYVFELASEIIIDAYKNNCTHVAVMGEPGLVVASTAMGKMIDIISITSTTTRISKDILQADGSVLKTSVFKHVQWRKLLP